jgi:hypothetical protein
MIAFGSCRWSTYGRYFLFAQNLCLVTQNLCLVTKVVKRARYMHRAERRSRQREAVSEPLTLPNSSEEAVSLRTEPGKCRAWQ